MRLPASGRPHARRAVALADRADPFRRVLVGTVTADRYRPLRPSGGRVSRVETILTTPLSGKKPADRELEAPADVVYVLAVGKKDRSVLRIAGEAVKI